MQAIIDNDKCTGCGRCVDACPAGAIQILEDEALAVVNAGFCTGCGLCVDACRKGAITLGEPVTIDTGIEPAGAFNQSPSYGRGMGQGRGMSGAGRGRGRGKGPGRGGGYCVCPQCGEQFPHRPGSPCSGIRCARCGSYMMRNETA